MPQCPRAPACRGTQLLALAQSNAGGSRELENGLTPEESNHLRVDSKANDLTGELMHPPGARLQGPQPNHGRWAPSPSSLHCRVLCGREAWSAHPPPLSHNPYTAPGLPTPGPMQPVYRADKTGGHWKAPGLEEVASASLTAKGRSQ